jgi:hypothetical protein
VEAWIDLDRGLVRQHVGSISTGGWALLIANGRQYTRFGMPADRDGPARDCLTSGITVSLVAPCTRSHEQPRTVGSATRDGRSLLVLDTDLTQTTKNLSATGTSRVWVDPKTGFPVASDMRSKARIGSQVVRHHATANETHEFVPASALPADFFTEDSVTAWATTAHTAGEKIREERQARRDQHPGTVLRTGSLSDGATWTLRETHDGTEQCLSLTIGDGAQSGGGSRCDGAASIDTRHLPLSTVTVVGHPAVTIVNAPRGTTAVKVTVHRGKRGPAVTVTSREPIATPNGKTAFVVELPASAHSNVSAKSSH